MHMALYKLNKIICQGQKLFPAHLPEGERIIWNTYVSSLYMILFPSLPLQKYVVGRPKNFTKDRIRILIQEASQGEYLRKPPKEQCDLDVHEENVIT